MREIVTVLMIFATCAISFGQEKIDSLEITNGEHKSERNMLLNAESATVPRELNIGLPEGGNGAVVFIDGNKHGNGLPRAQFHWSAGNAYMPNGSIELMESVISTGEIGICVDSWTRCGTDQLKGAFTIGTSSNGLMRFDGAINGKIGRGWYFNASIYTNNDPTSVNAPNRKFIDQKHIFKVGVTKRWGERGELNIQAAVSINKDIMDNGYSMAPFIYNGDGTITSFNDFRIGRDCFFPCDDSIEWISMTDGRRRMGNTGTIDKRILEDINIYGHYWTDNKWKLSSHFHLGVWNPGDYMKLSLAGTDNVDVSKGFTTQDGKPYTGYVQNRMALIEEVHNTDVNLILGAEKRFNSHHNLSLKLDLVYANQGESVASTIFAHSLDANPVRLLKNGNSTWSRNTNAQYFDGNKYSACINGFHKWDINDRIELKTGLRLRFLYNDIYTAAQMAEYDDFSTGKNKRVEGFNVANPDMCTLHRLQKPYLDGAVSEHMSFRLVDRFFFMAEGFYSLTGKSTTYFKNATIPTLNPIGNALARGGFTYDNKWFDCALLFSYITSWNNAKTMNVTAQIGGVSETIPYTAQYGIGTMGLTFDGNVRIGGFNAHLMATWQDPRYKNYRNEFVFSDGSAKIIDYTGNVVTGVSKVLVEFDPSYKWKAYRIWASVRYFSRQYASRSNSAYFNGHFETFAGVDFDLEKHGVLALNFINVLNQNGAKGSVDIADTIEDSELLKNYVMAGTYIRPFTVELSYTYKF